MRESRSTFRHLHPFPARMAPEIAFQALSSLPEGSVVLDPMCGSGTVLQQALRHGHQAIGFDTDPLSVLISRVSSQSYDSQQLLKEAARIAEKAESVSEQCLELPWIDGDEETRDFISFWFGKDQRKSLRKLAYLVSKRRGRLRNALQLAISKIIITKAPRASLARDTSHSRPHRVMETSDYDVIQGFQKAASQMVRQMERNQLMGSARVNRRDARTFPLQLQEQVDIVVTSPPYGNAIDYLRGHRLSLVWFGHTIPQLRSIRSAGVGSEKRSSIRHTHSLDRLVRELGSVDSLESATQKRLYRFAKDMRLVLKQIRRALKPDGRAVLVVGNSTIKGVFLDNARLVKSAAEQVGLNEVSRYTREIPANHRYLPPPKEEANDRLANRIREEVVLTLVKQAQA